MLTMLFGIMIVLAVGIIVISTDLKQINKTLGYINQTIHYATLKDAEVEDN
jgi:cell division protein FtsL